MHIFPSRGITFIKVALPFLFPCLLYCFSLKKLQSMKRCAGGVIIDLLMPVSNSSGLPAFRSVLSKRWWWKIRKSLQIRMKVWGLCKQSLLWQAVVRTVDTGKLGNPCHVRDIQGVPGLSCPLGSGPFGVRVVLIKDVTYISNLCFFHLVFKIFQILAPFFFLFRFRHLPSFVAFVLSFVSYLSLLFLTLLFLFLLSSLPPFTRIPPILWLKEKRLNEIIRNKRAFYPRLLSPFNSFHPFPPFFPIFPLPSFFRFHRFPSFFPFSSFLPFTSFPSSLLFCSFRFYLFSILFFCFFSFISPFSASLVFLLFLYFPPLSSSVCVSSLLS